MPEPQSNNKNHQQDENNQNQDQKIPSQGQQVNQEQGQGQQSNQDENKLSEADRQVYNQIFQSITKIGKKVNKAKGKMNQDTNEHKNANFKQIAQKLIQSKENSQIINKEDLRSDISQSYERAVVQIYTQNQKLKKKVEEMSQIIKDQNHKIFTHVQKQQKLTKQIESLREQLLNNKDQRLMNGRLSNSPVRLQGSNVKNQGQINSGKAPGQKTKNTGKNQNDQDYDFWSIPQNQSGKNKKKQFVQNSGLWVNQNQKNINDSMFITESKSKKAK